MRLIRKLAVKGYKRELAEFVNLISRISNEQQARLLVYGTWLRAILQLEGRLHFVNDEAIRLYEELHSYPIMLGNIEHEIAFTKKKAKGMGGEEKAVVLSIWVHTLRSILYPELNIQARKMWEHLMKGDPFWDKCLRELSDEDLKIGFEQDFVSQTEKLSRAILQSLPPKQLYL